MGTTKVRGKTSAGRYKQTKAASEQHRTNRRIKKTTERTLLQQLVEQLEKDKGALPEIMAKLLSASREGDKDALAFLGKYLLGNGKVGLDELSSPPLIKKSR